MKIDPRIAKDGVTVADLAEQTKFSLKVRDALAEARAVQTRVRQAMDAKRGDQAKLQGVWDRLTTKSGPYEDQMFVDQLSNVNRAIGQADQKVGACVLRAVQPVDEGVDVAQGRRRGDPEITPRATWVAYRGRRVGRPLHPIPIGADPGVRPFRALQLPTPMLPAPSHQDNLSALDPVIYV